MRYDVCVVGAGPAGLAAAIRLRQLALAEGREDLSVCVLEKGAEVGNHAISGNVFDPRALDELLPDWRDLAVDGAGAVPVRQPVTKDVALFLTSATGGLSLPVPPTMKNKGKGYVISLSQLTQWLGAYAEQELGVDIFPGFAASEVLFDSSDGGDGGAKGKSEAAIRGVATADMGIAKDGSFKETFTRGIALEARVTLFGEGCRGSLSEQLKKRFALLEKAGADPQTYGLGIKEVWQVPAEKHNPGEVWHTAGFPFDSATYGGGFLYHMEGGMVALGTVVGLDYANPYLSPFKEFQRFKLHPRVKAVLEGGQCLQYGARTLIEGGWQSLPFAGMKGGALIGCAAGTLNAARIKGVHTAMKSGMVAAEVAMASLAAAGEGEGPVDMAAYDQRLRESWVGQELYEARNFRPAFASLGMYGGMANAALEAFVLKGRAPWTLRHSTPDHAATEAASAHSPIAYAAPDDEITFDLPTSLYRSGTNHDHDQVAHLKLRDAAVPTEVNLPEFDGPEQRYCPAGVYEYVLSTADPSPDLIPSLSLSLILPTISEDRLGRMS